jgi:hypothetical protein
MPLPDSGNILPLLFHCTSAAELFFDLMVTARQSPASKLPRSLSYHFLRANGSFVLTLRDCVSNRGWRSCNQELILICHQFLPA